MFLWFKVVFNKDPDIALCVSNKDLCTIHGICQFGTVPAQVKDVTFFYIEGHAAHDRPVVQVVNGSPEDESIIVDVDNVGHLVIFSKLVEEF